MEDNMKNLKKKLLSLVMVACLVGAMFSMTGCGSESSGKNGSINIYVWMYMRLHLQK